MVTLSRSLTSLFTMILDYRGGTYIRQGRASSPAAMVRKWARSGVWSSMHSLRCFRTSLVSEEFLSDPDEVP
jgi:hypothetical protein